MLRTLKVRRQKTLRELAHVNRAIGATEKRLAEIQARIAVLTQATAKAA